MNCRYHLNNKLKQKAIILAFLFLLSTHAVSQIKSSTDDSGNLQFKGVIEAGDKSNWQIVNCISSSPFFQGVESYTESEEEAEQASFAKGYYSYTYRVDDLESPAGMVAFNFEYLASNGEINYRFFNFEHEQGSSKFESIGLLPEEWNEKVAVTFTEKQYAEIMKDLKFNVAHAVRMVKKYCTK